jgi:predicted ATPase
MIESVEFHNFKALRDTTLPLSRFTLIVGPNGSGKSTAMQALQAIRISKHLSFQEIATVGLQPRDETVVEVVIHWGEPYAGAKTIARWPLTGRGSFGHPHLPTGQIATRLDHILSAICVYSLDPQAIAAPTQLQPRMRLAPNGAYLAGVLDRLRDQEPERFESLNEELGRWLPEFDRILFETPQAGHRAIALRTREGHHKIQALDLSQGTLIALALLTLAYVPDPPPIVCLEEPDRGMHPRLLRNVKDAMYRLSYPESGGEKRDPIQVIATTHSPYLLDLYSDHPEEIVIAQKVGQNVKFERLSEMPDIDEILEGARLGDVWYTGILGGVPAHT